MAPEILMKGHISKAADVYAFGMVLWGEQGSVGCTRGLLVIHGSARFDALRQLGTWCCVRDLQWGCVGMLGLSKCGCAQSATVSCVTVAHASCPSMFTFVSGCRAQGAVFWSAGVSLLLTRVVIRSYLAPLAELYTAKRVFKGIPRALLGHQVTQLNR